MMDHPNESSAVVNVVQQFIDSVAGKGDEKELSAFMRNFLGNPTPDDGPGVLSSYVGFRFDGVRLTYIKESTTNGYHEDHGSEYSVKLQRAKSSNTNGWLPFTKELDDQTRTGYKVFQRIKPCKHVYVQSKQIWQKSVGLGCDTPAPGSARFLVMNPPGLKGWYELVYTIDWY